MGTRAEEELISSAVLNMPGEISSPHPAAHEVRRTRRIALVVIGVFLLVVLCAGFLATGMIGRVVVKLPDGGTFEYLGKSRGTHSAIKVRELTPTDMDGRVWIHQLAPPPTLKQKIHALTPAALQKHLPNAWRPPARSTPSPPRSSEAAMLWKLTSLSAAKEWRMSWVDCNGFESEGRRDWRWYAGSRELDLSTSLPPCRSPEVTLRLRDVSGRRERPMESCPLIAELRMKNPCLLPPSTYPIDTLPSTRTQGGVALILQSVVVDPGAKKEQERTRLRVTLPPDLTPKHWLAKVRIFNQRRTDVSLLGTISSSDTVSRAVQDGFSIETNQCFWSDSPWFVRVMLLPAHGVKHPLCTEILFEDIPLPNHPAPVAPVRKSAGGFHATPAQFSSGGKKSNGRLTLALDRTGLPEGSTFRIVSATDDLGRIIEWDMDRYSIKTLANGDVCAEYAFTGPDDLKATSVDVTVGFVTPLVFDFHVMPEFMSKMEQPESNKVSAASSR
jgi:hypothetical protein